ncbi:MAG: RNA 2',3'-cyclic phosphodiesterase [Thermoleophilia bacterium]
MTSRNKKQMNNQLPRRQGENHRFRLFVAVELPAETTKTLVSWQSEYLSSDPALRMTPVAQLHITLVFIGPAGDRERELAFTQMDELSVRDAIPASISGLVGLPQGRSPRVIAARVEEPTGVLGAIHGELADGLAAKGIYRREKRPFFPHATIARARGRTSVDLSAIAPEPVQFTAVRVTLYNSILKPNEALHKALKTVQLT